MSFYIVEPEVAGELGDGTVFDRTTRPVSVTQVEYVFTSWLGDALLESTPAYIVTEDLAKTIQAQGLTGAEFGEVTISLSQEGEELITDPLPNWKWLQLTGKPSSDDFAVDKNLMLIVSARALEILQAAGLENADIQEV